MSYYTTQVRWVIEQKAGDKTLPIVQQIEKACPLIFNFDFPIWNESYRIELEKKILMHYFNKEIGLETVALWQFYLMTKLNEIMPYYNKLYETTVREYDYLADTDMTEIMDKQRKGDEIADFSSDETGKTVLSGTEDTSFSGKNDTVDTASVTNEDNTISSGTTENTISHSGENHETSGDNGNSGTKTINSDMPQANYAGKDYATLYQDVTENHSIDKQLNGQDSYTDSDKGGTSGTSKTTSEGNSSRNINVTSTSDNLVSTDNTTDVTKNLSSLNKVGRTENEDYTFTRKGTNGSKSFTELMNLYRASLLNIDMMIINDLADLFMMVY